MAMYYITLNNQTIGPMSLEQMMAYPVSNDTPVSRDGGSWMPLYTFPELMEAYRNSGKSIADNAEITSKKTLCGIMATILGGLGVQYFVLGKVGAGFITILLSVITCGLWQILTLIQGILMLCMTDADFKRKYIDSTSTLPLF